MSGAPELRFTRTPVEVRGATDGRTIGGYAAKFDRLSKNLGGFVERIAPGFFDKSRDDHWRDVMARYNHDDLLGTTAAGSLRLALDDTGLDYSVDMLPDAVSERVFQLVQRGDVRQSSFAFYTFEDEWGMTDQGFPVRTLVSGQLVDVAPVDNPAYADTSTGLRSLAAAREVDLSEVQRMAAENKLSDLLKPPAVVIDLAGSGQSERSDTPDSAGRIHVLRRALDLKK
jgi:HK97 family phage prohead protease